MEPISIIEVLQRRLEIVEKERDDAIQKLNAARAEIETLKKQAYERTLGAHS